MILKFCMQAFNISWFKLYGYTFMESSSVIFMFASLLSGCQPLNKEARPRRAVGRAPNS